MRVILSALFLMLFATASVSLAQERDGKEWADHNDSWKYAYVTGLLDGVTTGADFTLPTLSKGSIVLYKEDKACLEKAQTTIDYNTSRFFFGLSLKEFVEGLDAFYKDPANRNIPVNKAVRVWAMKRKNIPEADDLLRQLREEWAEGK